MGLAELVFAAGVVGAGGAGFPTHRKFTTGVKLLVINAVECEPLLASDRLVMRTYPHEIVAGISRLAAELGAPRVVIGTKAEYTRELQGLRAAIAAANAPIEIHEVESFYPAGDEQTLIFEITGETVPPGGLPAQLGIVVVNVTTVVNIERAADGIAVTRRFVTVSGEVAHPGVYDVPIGTTAADLIQAAGGAKVTPFALVKGGPMMGKQFPMRAAPTLGFGKADGGLIVLPADHHLIEFGSQPIDRLVAQTQSNCIQCGLCTELCPRYLIGHQLRPSRVMRSIGTSTHPTDLIDALLCCECGICELFACPTGLFPRRMNIYVKGMLRAEGAKVTDVGVHTDHQANWQHRKLAQSRLIERLDLSAYQTRLDAVCDYEPDAVIVPLRNGVGRAAQAAVAVGKRVRVGDVIGSINPDELGSLAHASIDGRVAEVTPDYVRIERQQ